MKKLITFSIIGMILLIGIGYAYITSNVGVAIDSKLYDGEMGKSSSSLEGYSYEIKTDIRNGTTYKTICVKTRTNNAGCKVMGKEEKESEAIKIIIERYLTNKKLVTTSSTIQKGNITLTKDLGGVKE